MTTNNSETLQFYRDSRRPQAWGGFFLALWMAIYIGGVVPVWVIAVGALLTMTLMAGILLRYEDDIAALQFRDESNHLHEVYVVFDEDLQGSVNGTDVELVDKR